jgi:hypothetical protein
VGGRQRRRVFETGKKYQDSNSGELIGKIVTGEK